MKKKGLNKWMKWSFLIVIISCLFLPWILTSNYTGIDFSESGQIGDTIAGITSPLIGLFAAFLVYLSFEQQRLANEYLSKESTYNYITKRLTSINNKFESFRVTQSATYSFCEKIRIETKSFFDKGYFIDVIPEKGEPIIVVNKLKNMTTDSNILYSRIQKLYHIASNYLAFTEELLDEKNTNFSNSLKLEMVLEIENDIEFIIKDSASITLLIDSIMESDNVQKRENQIVTILGKLINKLEKLFENSKKLKLLED